MNLKELAGKLGLEFKGPGDYEIKGVRDLEHLAADAVPEENYVYFVESKKVLKNHPRVGEKGAILTTQSLAGNFERAMISPDKDVRLGFIDLLKLFDTSPSFEAGVSDAPRIHPTAKIASSASILPGAVVMEGAVIGKNCRIYPGVVVEPFAEVMDDTTLHSNVVIGYRCVIGKRCIIHGGTVIGADGFGFHDQDGKRYKIPQIGNVVLDDDVEVGASCTIDRATIETTKIGTQTKLDDQVHIGHNCRLGRFIYIVGNSALGGSVEMGDGAMISGMVIIKPQLKIAKGSIVMGHSAVAKDTEPGKMYFGTPARPAKEMHRINASLAKVPEAMSQIRALEKKLSELGLVPSQIE
jgi:UDP-3-O-[3-hydroxymyristoyl] glucosamine N-acyltransferase